MANEAKRWKVLAGVDDLYFATRMQAVAREVDTDLTLASDADQLWIGLQAGKPDLLILDLNSKTCAPVDTVRRIKSDPALSGIRVIGFLSHIQVDLEKAAREAGCDLVLSRSRFTATLPKILQLRIEDCGLRFNP